MFTLHTQVVISSSLSPHQHDKLEWRHCNPKNLTAVHLMYCQFEVNSYVEDKLETNRGTVHISAIEGANSPELQS